MPSDRDSRYGGGRPGPKNHETRSLSLENLSDDTLAKLYLKPRRENKPWWAQLIDWLWRDTRR